MKNTFYFLLINKIFPGNVSNNIRIIITRRKKKVNSIHYRNTTGINTVLNLRRNKQYVPIILHALIISLKLFDSAHCAFSIKMGSKQRGGRGGEAKQVPPN